jgi:thiamine-phosphate pyrophosphorylase
MSNADVRQTRLCLITPRLAAPELFAPRLEAALSGGDVACLIIRGNGGDPDALQRIAAALVPIAQRHGTAALIHNDTRIAGRTKADGVHIDSGMEDLKEAIRTFRPRNIVGAGDVRTRHDALIAGEAEPDYVFFGRLDGDSGEGIFPKALDLAAWWSDLVEIPAMVMGGHSLDSVVEARDAGVDFVALSRAVWDAPAGPGAAVREVGRLLGAAREPVA